MKKCTNCGHENDYDAKFCVKCGSYIPNSNPDFVLKETSTNTTHIEINHWCQNCNWCSKEEYEYSPSIILPFTSTGVRYVCTRMNKIVDEYGSCDHFWEKPDEKNSGYKVDDDWKNKYSGGSNGGGSYCFLTSACVDYLGKPDDCEELTTLRKFRDEYMKKTEQGKALVAEYYNIAPNIVKKIDASDKKADYYAYIYSVITDCITLINDNNNECALNEYKAMVQHLSNELLH